MKKIIYSGLILILLGLVGAIATFVIKNPFLETKKKEVISAIGVKNIEVASASTDVILTPTKQKDITVQLVGRMSKNMKDNFQLNIDKNDGTIVIGLKNKHLFNVNFMAFSHTRLEINIPENEYQSLSIKTTSGDILAKGMHVKKLGVISSSGDIQLENGTVENQMIIKTSSGDINTNVQNSKTASVSTLSGSMLLKNISGTINAKSSSGDISIHPNDKIEGISVEALSGDVLIQTNKKELPFDINFKAKSGDGLVKGRNVNYTVKSEHIIVGKISTGTIKLKVRTSSGDFMID